MPNGQTCWAKIDLKLWPLFGVFDLVSRPLSIVIIVEGEKAAQAARRLFPNCVVVTSKGGANGAKKTDWTKLAGRIVIVWPDNDVAGLAYADAVSDSADRHAFVRADPWAQHRDDAQS